MYLLVGMDVLGGYGCGRRLHDSNDHKIRGAADGGVRGRGRCGGGSRYHR